MDLESFQIRNCQGRLEEIIDVAEVGQGPFPAYVCFAAENDLVTDRELVEENAFFRRGALDEGLHPGDEFIAFAFMGTEVGMDGYSVLGCHEKKSQDFKRRRIFRGNARSPQAFVRPLPVTPGSGCWRPRCDVCRVARELSELWLSPSCWN